MTNGRTTRTSGCIAVAKERFTLESFSIVVTVMIFLETQSEENGFILKSSLPMKMWRQNDVNLSWFLLQNSHF